MPQLRNKAGSQHNGATRNFGMPPATAVKQDAARFRAQRGQIILLDANFFWLDADVKKVLMLWGHDTSIAKIAEHIRRPQTEVMLLLVHLADKERLPARKGGLY